MVHTIVATSEVDGGMAGDTPCSAGWIHGVARDWRRRGAGWGATGDGRDSKAECGQWIAWREIGADAVQDGA
jgi:hypothetical protein